MPASTSMPCPMHHCHFHWLTAHSAFCPEDEGEGNMIPQSVGNNLPGVIAECLKRLKYSALMNYLNKSEIYFFIKNKNLQDIQPKMTSPATFTK
jgi:hypothetical protein